MGGMGNPVSDDRVELVDDNVGIRYRLRKCGKTRLVIIAVVVAVLVIGGIVAAAYLLTSKFSYINHLLCNQHSEFVSYRVGA